MEASEVERITVDHVTASAVAQVTEAGLAARAGARSRPLAGAADVSLDAHKTPPRSVDPGA